MLNSSSFHLSIEKAQEDSLYSNVTIKGQKFTANIYKTSYTFGAFTIKALDCDCFGYKWEVFEGMKSLGSFYKLTNAKKHIIEVSGN